MGKAQALEHECRVFGVVVVRREEFEHFEWADARIHASRLEHHADATHELAVIGNRIEAEDAHAAGSRPSVALQCLDGRGLACTVRSEQRQHLAGLDGERHAVDGAQRAVRNYQLVDFDHSQERRPYRSSVGPSKRALRPTSVPPMLDIRRIRTDLEGVLAGLARRADGSLEGELKRAVVSDDRMRAIVAERDELRSQINVLSKQVGALHREGNAAQAEDLQEQSRVLGERERMLASEFDNVAGLLRETLLGVPNIPADDAPDGRGPEDNVIVKTVGFDPGAYAEHQRVPHWDIGAELGLLDPERASKLSGSMFVLYRGFGARLLRALTQMALDRHTAGESAYEEVRPPSIVRTETMTATGQLPKFADDAYHLERDDLWLIPTAEAPLTSMHRDEILEEAELPRRFTAYTPCFRREAGAAGRG